MFCAKRAIVRTLSKFLEMETDTHYFHSRHNKSTGGDPKNRMKTAGVGPKEKAGKILYAGMARCPGGDMLAGQRTGHGQKRFVSATKTQGILTLK